ncbi:MAG: hypothetical protein FJW63_06550 [Actinobacteria bacterium]|nr:hypothetical protein [Actinomycetota bacterium]
MPGFDGTGPLGQGPLTGGGRGYCIAPISSEKNLPTGYTGLQEYSISSGYPYSLNYRRPDNHLYNYSYYMQSGIYMFPQRRWNYIGRGYGRFSRIGRGRGMSGRRRRF